MVGELEEKRANVSGVRSLPQSFWVANVMEIVERMAWYGFYALSSVYMCDAVSEGGLGLTSSDRGIIQGAVTFLIYLFPFVTGALGDRYGYKKMLLISYLILSPSYLLLGWADSMPTFFAAFLCVGIGASIFKPLVVGTVGRCSDAKNGSLAFGIFYMMVNIGGFVGPLIATTLRSQGWAYVFYASAAWIALNIPILLFFYKEPPRDEVQQRVKGFRQVLHEVFEVIGNGRFFVMFFVTLILFVMGCKWFAIQHVSFAAFVWIALNLLADVFLRLLGKRSYCMRVGHKRFLIFLLLLSFFWIAYNQLFITLPLYISDAIDTRPLMEAIMGAAAWMGLDVGNDGAVAMVFMDKSGGVKPEHLVNINAFCIIFFQLFVSMFNRRIAPLIGIMIGIFLTALSFVLIGLGANVWMVMVGVAVFSFGEMMASPRAKEYAAHAVAPKDKVGMYMGYYMWSNALGSLFGGILSGALYRQIAQEMSNPMAMWFIFASLSLACCGLIYVYHCRVGRQAMAE